MQFRSLDWEDPLKEENGNAFQYSRLKNRMDRGVWRRRGVGVLATVQSVRKSDITEKLSMQHLLNAVIKNITHMELEEWKESDWLISDIREVWNK